jgi:type I restriction enzyme R subunit
VKRAMDIVKEGKKFTPKQEEWLNLIENHLVENLVIDRKDFGYPPFSRHGSWKKADEVFEGQLPKLLTKINVAMIQCRK